MASLTFDHEDEGDQLLAQALYVSDNEGEENDQPAASGEEYLRKVVKERKKFEDIETGKWFWITLLLEEIGWM